MTNGEESSAKRRQRGWAILVALLVLIVALVVPPLVNVGHYKTQITELISQTFGRPVRFSSVNVRLLPWPAFEVDDLSIAEDPVYGAEPVLHAGSVTASIRLRALWRGRLEIGKVKVDEANLNVVRTSPGVWNIDALFRNAATQTGQKTSAQSLTAAPLPELVATNSRIDFKDGVEKLPFSLLNTDFSLTQDSAGGWRIRLRGQPARTDVSLFQEDTGEVRLDATVRRAPALRLMPVHLEMEWREAQLGQLARLLTGTDPGWRGDLTGELHLDGTAVSAQTAIRLRAQGVHRAEFVPAAPMDFDANCSFLTHYAQRSVENVVCNSPVGDGHLQMNGDHIGGSAPSHVTLALDRIPVAAGLDAFRTLRSGIPSDLQAAGTVSGKIMYASDAQAKSSSGKPQRGKKPAASDPAASPLSGSLSIENLAFSGAGLSSPISMARMTVETESSADAAGTLISPGLAGTASMPAGAPTPLAVSAQISLKGYQFGIRGLASIARARELAHAAGIPGTDALDSLAGDPLSLDLEATGPWVPQDLAWTTTVPQAAASASSPQQPRGVQSPTPSLPATDSLTGTVTLHNANWKSGYLASHLVMTDATLHVQPGMVRWDPINFTYGPVKGTATLVLPLPCQPESSPQPCPFETVPQFTVDFGDLDVAALQTALLGAQHQGTLISSLIDRFHPASAPPWPRAQGTVTASSLIIDPVTLSNFSADVVLSPTDADLTRIDATLFKGELHATGSVTKPATDRDKPGYMLEGDFKGIDAASLGHLLGLRWTGAPISGSGKLTLSGYTGEDLAASAKGTVHVEAAHGAMASLTSLAKPSQMPAALAHFDRLVADGPIVDGAAQMNESQAVSGGRKQAFIAKVKFATPASVTFDKPQPPSAADSSNIPPKRGFR